MTLRKCLITFIAGSMLLTGCVVNSTPGKVTHSSNTPVDESINLGQNSIVIDNNIYYIAGALEQDTTENNNYLYCYDNSVQKSYPLCSKVDCKHNGDSCDAYVSNSTCVNNWIGQYNSRIYMVEQTDEKDYLVSYDKLFQNKTIEATLCESDYELDKFSGFCISDNSFYYSELIKDMEHPARIICKISLESKETESTIQDDFESLFYDRVKIYTYNDLIYIFKVLRFEDGRKSFRIFNWDTTNNSMKLIFDAADNSDFLNSEYVQLNDIVYLKNGCAFIKLHYDTSAIIKKISLQNGECSTLADVGLNDSYSADHAYIGFCDSNNIYLYASVNPKDKENTNNEIFIYTQDGEFVDKYKLMTDKSNLTFMLSFIYSDSDKLLLIAPKSNLLNTKYSDKTVEMISKAKSEHKSFAYNIPVTLNRSYFTTGTYELIDVSDS